jgi:hypothetical protein
MRYQRILPQKGITLSGLFSTLFFHFPYNYTNGLISRIGGSFMTMTARVQCLRQGSLDAVPSLSAERAQLITAFYRATEGSTLSAAVRRAEAFAYLMEHKTVCILPGELIVGEKGPAPKAAPTYPELCCHSLDDLDILDRREKIPFRVSPEVRQVYAEQIIPYWQGHSMRERIFAEMTPEWLDAYDAGIYTEFMEQRAPGHTVLDDKIYRRGMLDFIAEIEAARASLDYLEDPAAYARSEQLKAMALCARASSALPSATPSRPKRWPSPSPTLPAAASWRRSRRSVAGCRPTPRAPSGRRCRPTGSCTWA